MKETNVTIISTNLNRKLLDNYKDYKVIDDDFNYEELLNSRKVVFFNVLNNLTDDQLNKLFTFLNNNNILFVNFTNNLELCLYTAYLTVCDEKNILAEGKTIDILQNDKLLRRLGFEIPFIVDLSILLKDYSLISKIYLDKESLVSDLWK